MSEERDDCGAHASEQPEFISQKRKWRDKESTGEGGGRGKRPKEHGRWESEDSRNRRRRKVTGGETRGREGWMEGFESEVVNLEKGGAGVEG